MTTYTARRTLDVMAQGEVNAGRLAAGPVQAGMTHESQVTTRIYTEPELIRADEVIAAVFGKGDTEK